MIKLEFSQSSQRKIRQDDMEDLSIPTWDLVKRAIRDNDAEEALRYLEYAMSETKNMHDSLVSFADGALAVIAGFDEEAIYRFLRKRYRPRIEKWLASKPTVVENMQRFSEQQRAHFSHFEIKEERDRFVMSGPCGSGGRLRRTVKVATTQKPYPWSWGKSNVPYYCVHCCIAWEILPVEAAGFPLRIHLVPESPEESCVHLFYKKPKDIPEEYYERIGQRKTLMK